MEENTQIPTNYIEYMICCMMVIKFIEKNKKCILSSEYKQEICGLFLSNDNNSNDAISDDNNSNDAISDDNNSNDALSGIAKEVQDQIQKNNFNKTDYALKYLIKKFRIHQINYDSIFYSQKYSLNIKEVFEMRKNIVELCSKYSQSEKLTDGLEMEKELYSISFKAYKQYCEKIEIKPENILNETELATKNDNYDEKWRAENIKLDYYTKRYNAICEQAFGYSEEYIIYKDYFTALKQEIYDIQNRSKYSLNKRGEFEKNISLTSIVTTVMSASLTAFEGLKILASNTRDESDVYLWGYRVLAVAVIILPLIITTCSAIHTQLIKKRDFESPQETWLRHQLNYSRIMNEIDQFCNGSEKYKNIGKLNSNLIKKEIIKFQTNINILRNTDYDNFFKNMNCNNFEIEKPKDDSTININYNTMEYSEGE